METARKIVLARHFRGEPREDDFRVEEEELPAVREGEVLCQAAYLSVDPYQRARAASLQPGDTIMGYQVALIVQSRCAEFPVGRYLVGDLGWRSATVLDPRRPPARPGATPTRLLPADWAAPYSLALGALGRPGVSAYFGLLELGRPKHGDVVVVSGAAGAVGSLVGQIARIHGCKVIGFAGSDEKVRWLKEELQFDEAFNYRTTDARRALKEVAPAGVDVYFDNVGGELSSAVLPCMRHGGRVPICGAVCAYNSEAPVRATTVQPAVVGRELVLQGFLVSRWLPRWDEAVERMRRWVLDGRLVCRETVSHGFDSLPRAFIGMLRGDNLGKAVVKV
ncbi:prostaglandin reductase 1-like [Schistocerca piceifrons]|uniref:prostaglandin reductase 1-like n=1 Tax=Schistocerca piceifrons TaxID=274613 RepID=UPI001F5EAB1A|nr:prostaglandin reductase 1-like [Schistocerca piceifrons]